MKVVKILSLLLALLSTVVTWITLKPSLSLLNWSLIGLVLFLIATALKVGVVQGLVQNVRRDRLGSWSP